MLNKRTLTTLSLVTLFGFSLIGLFIIWKFVDDYTPIELFAVGLAWYKQLFYGALFGLSGAAVAIWLMSGKWYVQSRLYFTAMIERLSPGYLEILFYSLCAGIGEEILFRGAIQPFIGVWPTAILFIVLHGYINPFNWALTLYGVIMVVVSAGFGYLFWSYGIYAAIVAHSIFDIVMFIFLKQNAKNFKNIPVED